MSFEGVSPYAFRLASLTLELIERRRTSLEVAFQKALNSVGRSDPHALKLARRALLSFAKADLLLEASGLGNIPLRRKCAYRVAFALLEEGVYVGRLEAGLLSDRLRALLTRRALEEVTHLVSGLPPAQRLAVENSFPPWIIDEVSKHLGLREAEKLVKACSRRTIWIRINELKISRGKALSALRRYADLREDKEFPEVLELVGVEDPPPDVLKMAERGLIVIQDKGSVAVAHALGDSRNLLVMDAAAAPGLKTSLLQQLSNNEAEIVAVDVSRRRLGEMRKLLSRLGVRNVRLLLADSRIAKFTRKFDKILLDAPCTNTGAIASDPALRLVLWKPAGIDKFPLLQKSLLTNTLEHLKDGGDLVYSTCSLLSSEGESLIETLPLDWLSSEGLWGLPGYQNFACSSRVRRLFPHIHRTTAFFVAKIRPHS